MSDVLAREKANSKELVNTQEMIKNDLLNLGSRMNTTQDQIKSSSSNNYLAVLVGR